MTRILLIGLTPPVAKELKTKLTELGNDVEDLPGDDILNNYEEHLPDILLINYTDESFYDISRRIVEFDNTACIFALTGPLEDREAERMYKSGVRVIMDTPKLNKLEQFVDRLFRSCNDLEHENCIGCWKLGRFENLTKLN